MSKKYMFKKQLKCCAFLIGKLLQLELLVNKAFASLETS